MSMRQRAPLSHLSGGAARQLRPLSQYPALHAIRSFFRLVALRDPDSLGIVTRILAIPMKREDHKLIGYLTRTEIQALVAAPDQLTWSGRRDHALLLTLYNSGARVSES